MKQALKDLYKVLSKHKLSIIYDKETNDMRIIQCYKETEINYDNEVLSIVGNKISYKNF